MSISKVDRGDRVSDPTGPVASEQLRELKALAELCGRTFAWPSNCGEAEAELERLRAEAPDDEADEAAAVERFVDRRAVSRGLVCRQGAAVRDDEIVGWGSTARWR